MTIDWKSCDYMMRHLMWAQQTSLILKAMAEVAKLYHPPSPPDLALLPGSITVLT